jgi:hydrogenase 3 maturation protease
MKRLLLGVGNRLLGDDGIGPEVATALAGSHWQTIDAGVSPENVTGEVAREAPDLLVVVDAADMGLAPGSIRRLPWDDAPRMLVSTHGLPLPFILDRLREAAGAIVLIGVQPSRLVLGEDLTDVARDAVRALVTLLRDRGPDSVPVLDDAESASGGKEPSTPRVL